MKVFMWGTLNTNFCEYLSASADDTTIVVCADSIESAREIITNRYKKNDVYKHFLNVVDGEPEVLELNQFIALRAADY
jgi:hypothetical protein